MLTAEELPMIVFALLLLVAAVALRFVPRSNRLDSRAVDVHNLVTRLSLVLGLVAVLVGLRATERLLR